MSPRGSCAPPQLHPWPHHARSPLRTHSSQQRGSRQLHLHSPCLHHRASALARRHSCPGTGRILCCRLSALEKGQVGRKLLEGPRSWAMCPRVPGCPKAGNPGEQRGSWSGRAGVGEGTAEVGVLRDRAASWAGTGRSEQGLERLTAAAVLIRAIPTVVCPITHPELGDAAVVVAFELHGVAELVWERRGGAQSWGNAAGWTQQQHVARLSQLGARAGAGNPAAQTCQCPHTTLGQDFCGIPCSGAGGGGVPSSWVLLEVCLGRLEQKTSLK